VSKISVYVCARMPSSCNYCRKGIITIPRQRRHRHGSVSASSGFERPASHRRGPKLPCKPRTHLRPETIIKRNEKKIEKGASFTSNNQLDAIRCVHCIIIRLHPDTLYRRFIPLPSTKYVLVYKYLSERIQIQHRFPFGCCVAQAVRVEGGSAPQATRVRGVLTRECRQGEAGRHG